MTNIDTTFDRSSHLDNRGMYKRIDPKMGRNKKQRTENGNMNGVSF